MYGRGVDLSLLRTPKAGRIHKGSKQHSKADRAKSKQAADARIHAAEEQALAAAVEQAAEAREMAAACVLQFGESPILPPSSRGGEGGQENDFERIKKKTIEPDILSTPWQFLATFGGAHPRVAWRFTKSTLDVVVLHGTTT